MLVLPTVIKPRIIVMESAPVLMRIPASSGMVVWLVILTLIVLMLDILTSVVMILLRLWVVPKDTVFSNSISTEMSSLVVFGPRPRIAIAEEG